MCRNVRIEGGRLGIYQTQTALEADSPNLRPILNAKDGFYQIGPVSEKTKKFQFRVGITKTENLEYLVDPEKLDRAMSEQFQFSTVLFGNVINSSKFRDLRAGKHPHERATVSIHSDLSTILKYFSQEQASIYPIQILCGDTVIAKTEFNIRESLVSYAVQNGCPASVYIQKPLLRMLGTEFTQSGLDVRELGASMKPKITLAMELKCFGG